MDRYRTRIYRYGKEYLRQIFIQFLREEAVVMSLAFDSTPMKIFTLQKRVGSREVYAWTLTAANAEGKEMKLHPMLALPLSSKASGILSTFPIKDLFLDDFLSRPGFRILLISSDGVNSNKAAIRTLVAELSRYKQQFRPRPSLPFVNV